MKIADKLSIGGAILLIGGIMVLLRPQNEEPPIERSAPTQSVASRPPTQHITSVSKVRHPASEAIEPFLPILNAFIAKVRPYGVETSVRAEDLILFRTNANGRVVQLQTAKSFWDIENGKVSFFASLFDGSDTRRDPSAERTWYQATGRWTKEEAVRETLSILQTLGKEILPLGRVEYEADPITVMNPKGTKVTVIAFHTVRLSDANGHGFLNAEFRMSSSGPGRLTRWSDRCR